MRNKKQIEMHLKFWKCTLLIMLLSIATEVSALTTFVTGSVPSFTNRRDSDGDGCFAGTLTLDGQEYFTLNWRVQTSTGDSGLYEKIYYRRLGETTWNLLVETTVYSISGTLTILPRSIDITTGSSCSTWEYRIELWKGSSLSTTIRQQTQQKEETITADGGAPIDTQRPSVAITFPTSAAAFATTEASLNLSGTATDDVGVTSVTWENNRGGSGAAANGPQGWGYQGIPLQAGANVITVTARDAAGNTGTDVLTVTYTLPGDTVPPVVSITFPTGGATLS
jgi:hypothetical protein